MAPRAPADDRYPTPPPRILARLVELPFFAIARTIERLLGVRPASSRRAGAADASSVVHET